MLITSANVGDVIRMDHSAKYIRIEAVSDGMVHYRSESGDQYSTFEHEIQGSIEKDPARIQQFAYNSTLGSALNRAEFSAFQKALNGTASHEEQKEAASVLDMSRKMKTHLNGRVLNRAVSEQNKAPSHSSLASMISKAAAEAHAQKPSFRNRSFRKERE